MNDGPMGDAPVPRALLGPSFGPAAGGRAEWLVVLLHGVGADGNDLIGLAPYIGQMIPAARVIAPDGPEPCDMAPFGRQWFSLQDRDSMVLYAGAERARVDIDAFLDRALAALGLPDDRLVLAGFSQGAMTAMHVGLRRPRSPACIIAFSGALVGRNRLEDEMNCHPPMLLVHGEEDPVVPATSAREAERTLLACGIDVMAHVLPGLGHNIDERGLALTAKFLQRLGISR
jgi:phospholipase/carboxylesterase